ncbi:MAG TPA: transposase [Chloroflexota bacterium]
MDVAYIHISCRPRPLIYHFAWGPMRAKPVLVDEIAEALNALLREKAALLAVGIRDLRIQPALVYLMVDAPPMVSPHSIACGLKAHSSSALRRTYKELTTIPTLWTREYLVAAGEHIRAEELMAAYLAMHAPQRRPRGRPPCRLSRCD